MNVAWRDFLVQGGSTGEGTAHTMALADDGSVILAGSTAGVWGKEGTGSGDFAAHKLDEDGNLIWTWQVNCRSLLSHLEARLGIRDRISFGRFIGVGFSAP